LKEVLSFAAFFVASGFMLFFGFFMYLRPADAIDVQKRFYARINWRIEPVNLEKELRNTRAMGIALLVLAVSAIVVYLVVWG
jgi:hypothetical protein